MLCAPVYSVPRIAFIKTKKCAVCKWVNKMAERCVVTRKCQNQTIKYRSKQNSVLNRQMFFLSLFHCTFTCGNCLAAAYCYQLNKWAIHAWNMYVCTWMMASSVLFSCVINTVLPSSRWIDSMLVTQCNRSHFIHRSHFQFILQSQAWFFFSKKQKKSYIVANMDALFSCYSLHIHNIKRQQAHSMRWWGAIWRRK